MKRKVGAFTSSVKRPTETVSGFGLAFFVFEFLHSHGWTGRWLEPAAGLIALGALAAPRLLSAIVDRIEA
jgi:hypothetical protein